MQRFNWEAKTRTGEKRKGVIEADNIDLAQSKLRAQNLTVTKVKVRPKPMKLPWGGKVSVQDQVTFSRLFATMVDAGLPLVQCLDILASQQADENFADVLRKVKADVEGGSTFSEALGKHNRVFDELYVNLVQAGEAGGILDSIMARLATYLEKRQKLQRQIKSALSYPIIVACIAVGVIIVMLVWVIPAFEAMFKEFGAPADALPGITRLMIGISRDFLSWAPILAIVAGSATFAFIKVMRNPVGKHRVHRAMLNAPILGNVLRKIAVARFTRTMGTLLQSGVPILDALDICAKTAGNLVIEKGITYVRSKIAEGHNLAEPLIETAVFPEMVVQMIAVGEQTGALDQMLNKIADFYEEETDLAVEGMTGMLEPIMMVGIGGLVGTVLVSMYLPIFSLAGNIKAD